MNVDELHNIDAFIIISPREFEEYTKQKARITALTATNKFLAKEADCKTALIKELRETIVAQHKENISLMQFAKRMIATAESAPVSLMQFARRMIAAAESAPECVMDRRYKDEAAG